MHQVEQYNPPVDGLQTIFADEAMLIVSKPSGLLSVPGRGAEFADCLIGRVQQHTPDARIVHRLDMATSGLMVLARGPQMERVLSKQFQAQQVQKRYTAVVHGQIAQEQGLIDAPLLTDWPNRPKQMIDDTNGKPAQTRYRVLHVGAEATRIELEPLTGRTHQLRVHLLHLGHPICGDALYAPVGSVERYGRLHLHAHALRLMHPVTLQWFSFEDAVPF